MDIIAIEGFILQLVFKDTWSEHLNRIRHLLFTKDVEDYLKINITFDKLRKDTMFRRILDEDFHTKVSIQ